MFFHSADPILSKQYWYFSSYFVLFLFMPFLRQLIHALDAVRLRQLAVTLVLCFSLLPLFMSGDVFSVASGYSQPALAGRALSAGRLSAAAGWRTVRAAAIPALVSARSYRRLGGETGTGCLGPIRFPSNPTLQQHAGTELPLPFYSAGQSGTGTLLLWGTPLLANRQISRSPLICLFWRLCHPHQFNCMEYCFYPRLSFLPGTVSPLWYWCKFWAQPFWSI